MPGLCAPRAVFPFLVGCPRSGTTMLRAMVDAHPQIAIPGESHFIIRLARERERYETPSGFDCETFLADLLDEPRFRLWRLCPDSVRAALVEAVPLTLASALRTIFAAYAAGRGKPLYGDKTPGYVRSLPCVAGLFPEARFVHLIRDGRDVALSLKDMGWATRDMPTLAAFWQTNVRRGREAHTQLGTERYLEVRYEELIDDPETILRCVCGFLDLRFEPAMLAYHGEAIRLRSSLRSPADHTRVSLPPTKGLRDWRTQMARDEVAIFETVAGTTLEDTGYGRALV